MQKNDNTKIGQVNVIELIKKVFDSGKLFTASQKIILIRFVLHGTPGLNKITSIYPSNKKMSLRLGVGLRTVIDSLNEFNKLDFMVTVARYNESGSQTSSESYIDVTKLLAYLIHGAVDKESESVDNLLQNCETNSSIAWGGCNGCMGGDAMVAPKQNNNDLPNLSIPLLEEHASPVDKVAALQDEAMRLKISKALVRKELPQFLGTYLIDEILYHVKNNKKIKNPGYAINAAVKLVSQGRWSTPFGFNHNNKIGE